MENENSNMSANFYKIESYNDDMMVDYDMFFDDKIQEVLKKYNYDYKFLLRELSSYLDYDELIEILKTLNISMNEYLNPTYEIFDKIRLFVIKENLLKKNV